MKRLLILPALLLLAGCLSLETQQSASIRRQMVDEARADMGNAYGEVIALAKQQLAADTDKRFMELDADYLSRLQQIINALADPAERNKALVQLLTNYNTRRQEANDELSHKALGFSMIAAKIKVGSDVLDALERMTAHRQAVERDLTRQILLGDILPVLLARTAQGNSVGLSADQVGKLTGALDPAIPPLGAAANANPVK